MASARGGRRAGLPPRLPPSPDASRTDVLEALWSGAGLRSVETRAIEVERRFENFEAYWRIALAGPTIAPLVASTTPGALADLASRMRSRLGAEGDAPVVCRARAHAVTGRVGA